MFLRAYPAHHHFHIWKVAPVDQELSMRNIALDLAGKVVGKVGAVTMYICIYMHVAFSSVLLK